MQVKIENERVRKNVELFLHILNMFITAELGKSLHQRVYKAYINRVNGEVLFTDLLPDPSSLSKKDWKVVLLRWEEEKGKIFFDVVEGEGSKEYFNCEELAPLAYKTVAETIHKLNECAKIVTKASASDKFLEDLSQLSIEPSSLKTPYDLIQACWHPLDRIGAEELLFKHPYGSFFFRKDEYAQWLEEMLSEKHPEPIKCFTLTVIEPERKVSDLTIVFIKDRCLIYNDDPSLAGNVYPDLTALLQSVKERCKYPVFH